MKTIDSAVRAKLQAQVGQDKALALWESLWTAYEAGGMDGAQALIESLLESPEAEEGEKTGAEDEEDAE